MGPSARLGPAAAHHYRAAVPLIAHDHGTDRRIGPSVAEPAPPQRERERHETGVDGGVDCE